MICIISLQIENVSGPPPPICWFIQNVLQNLFLSQIISCAPSKIMFSELCLSFNIWMTTSPPRRAHYPSCSNNLVPLSVPLPCIITTTTSSQQRSFSTWHCFTYTWYKIILWRYMSGENATLHIVAYVIWAKTHKQTHIHGQKQVAQNQCFKSNKWL